MRKLPNPRNSTLSPFASASVMLSKMVLTMVSVSFFVRLESLETSSIRSAFVIVDSVIGEASNREARPRVRLASEQDGKRQPFGDAGVRRANEARLSARLL